MEKFKILIVDDEEPFVFAVTEQLNKKYSDYEAEYALNAENALSLLKNKTYDVIVSDVRMPGISGLEMIATLRNLGISIPTIIITAFDIETTKITAKDFGSIAFIAKPFEFDDLLNIIETFKKEKEEKETTSQISGFDTVEIIQLGIISLFTGILNFENEYQKAKNK